jgi:hypothetical protein
MDLIPLQQFVEGLTDIEGEVWDAEKVVHSYIHEFKIEMPVELELLVDDEGKVEIRSAPPLYYVDTTFRPSYHAIRFTAIKFEPRYGYVE